jgi:hypothetical protein
MRYVCLLLAAIGCIGCATTPYRYGGDYHTACDPPLRCGEAQLERGSDRPVLDGVGCVLGLPGKILLLNCRVANHHVSEETEDDLMAYLAANNLDRVKVRINEYDPCGEWNRLVDNKSIAWPLRYTLGTLSVVGYTVLPGRLLGCDEYNPFTNTISLYSDVPAIALYEGASAKDYAQRQYKGLYALSRVVPGVPLICHEARAANDAMGYIEQNGTTQDVKEGYRTVCPMYVLHGCPSVNIEGLPVVLPAVVGGHLVGQAKAMSISDGPPPQTAVPAADTAPNVDPSMAARPAPPVPTPNLVR